MDLSSMQAVKTSWSFVTGQRNLLILTSLVLFILQYTTFAAGQSDGDYYVHLPLALNIPSDVVDDGGDNHFYISPDGNDSASGRSPATAWATFDRAWDDLYPGDTLTLLDGVYTQSLWPNERNGEPNNPITIRAQNDGQAIIDGEGVRVPVQLGEAWPGPVGDWFVVEGIVARNGDNVLDEDGRLEGSGSVIFLPGEHNVLRRVSAYDASPDGNSIIITFDFRGSHNTIEDCVAAGTGRKAIMMYNSDDNIVRRCVAMWTRFDGRYTRTWPWGENLDIYNSDNNLLENVISLGHVPKYGITIRANADHVTANDNSILGSMALYSGKDLNGDYMEWNCPPPDPQPDDTCLDIEANPGYRVGLKFFGTGQMNGNTVRDVLMTENASYGLSLGASPTNTVLDHVTIRDNDLSADPDEIAYLATGSNAISNSFIEGTNYQDEGARLQYRYVNGVLTDQPLWPWPMEQRIQDELGFSITEFVSDLINPDTSTPATTLDTPVASPVGVSALTKPASVSATTPTVYIPHFHEGDPFEAAVSWLGRVSPSNNYADLRFWHDNQTLKISAHVIDRLLWYDESAVTADLTEWDAVSLFLDTGKEQYRFEAQVNHWEDDEDYQAAYIQSGGAWELTAVPFVADTFYQGDAPNNTATLTDDRGWGAKFTIPFTSLDEVSSPPSRDTTWRIAIVVHDRDAINTAATTTTWPPDMHENDSSTWSHLVFNRPHYNPLPTLDQGAVTIRHGLNGMVVKDAHVGGHTECGTEFDPDFFNGWGDANYAGYSEINIQNQWDIADWPCFSKFYITFPLDPVPTGNEVVSATLTLHQFGNAWGQGIEPSWIQVATIADEWNEATLTWNNAPLPVENVSGTWVEPMNEPLEWPGVAWHWDVGYAVAQAYQSGQPLRLAMYSPDGAYHSGKYFSSSDTGNWNMAARPTLTVRWGQPLDIEDWLRHFLPLITYQF